MKVLVIGACGFLGSHVCEHFTKLGWKVVGMDNMTTYELDKTGMDSYKIREYMANAVMNMGVDLQVEDVTSLSSVTRLAGGCDYIINCAAQPAMTLAWKDPVNDFKVNALGTLNSLEAARTYQIPIALCSTIHVYGPALNLDLVKNDTRYNRPEGGISEAHEDMKGDITPLHASKKTLEIYGRAYIDTYNMQVGIFRLSGMYGPRQFGGTDHGWVANFAIKAVKNRKITVFGDGRQTRDILYATDAARLFEYFYDRGVPGLYTIGGGKACTMSLTECIDILGTLVGHRIHVIYEEARFGDLQWFVSSNEKVLMELGWKPEVLPGEGLCNMVEWVESVKEMV